MNESGNGDERERQENAEKWQLERVERERE